MYNQVSLRSGGLTRCLDKIVRAPRGTAQFRTGSSGGIPDICRTTWTRVAEKPADLVVYGGRGQICPVWKLLTRFCAPARAGTDETLLVQSGKPVVVFKSPGRPRVLIASQPGALGNRNILTLGARADHVRSDDRRLLDYIGAGHPAGTYDRWVRSPNKKAGLR